MNVTTKDLWNFTQSDGGHYSKPVPVLKGMGMEALRTMFPSGEANSMNFVLFSTSGVHGWYRTIEDHEADPLDEDGDTKELTFLIVQPRIVALRYGNVKPETLEDYQFLKKLRQSSWDAVKQIGNHQQ